MDECINMFSQRERIGLIREKLSAESRFLRECMPSFVEEVSHHPANAFREEE
jgi:hypothetical protein